MSDPRTAAQPTGAPVIEARELVKTYVDEEVPTPVLRGVDLAVLAGEMVALMGPSGSGKSTLLSILGTLLTPSSGEVRLLGESLSGFGPGRLGRLRNLHLGFVFQFHHLLPDFSALENVLLPAYARDGHESRRARKRALDLLARVGLEERAGFRATRLSGGQKQRVAVARALMNGPQLVLADEPTGNLDRATSREVLDLLDELRGEEGTAFLISTHDPEVAERCDRVIHLVDGRVVPDSGA